MIYRLWSALMAAKNGAIRNAKMSWRYTSPDFVEEVPAPASATKPVDYERPLRDAIANCATLERLREERKAEAELKKAIKERRHLRAVQPRSQANPNAAPVTR